METGPAHPPIDPGTRCPVCGSPSPAGIERLSYRKIWDALREEWGFRFSGAVATENTPSAETTLFACESCDLQFFEPAVPGNAGFYRELGENPRYYSAWKWEFGWAISRISRSAEVLDVGCGRGDFLEAVAPGVRRAVGTDENPVAIRQARERNLEVVEGEFSAHAAALAGTFTDVCAFHVLEHLAEPVRFLHSLRGCLRPGGSIFLSVPNRLRAGRPAFEPLDFPPHHLTRWSPRSLERLAEACGLRVREIAMEPVELSVPRVRLRDRVHSAVSAIPAVGGVLGKVIPGLAWRAILPSPLAQLYRRLGMFERAGMFGMSLTVRITAPPGRKSASGP